MTQASLKVRFAGPLVTFQDGGRPGQMRFGVSASGPMDRLAATAANVALGNAPGATLIEVSMGGLVLECTEGALSVAVTGGDFTVEHGSAAVPCWSILALEQGDSLSIRPGKSGSWAYLALAGEVAAESWLGSSATHSTSGFGGGALSAGQVIEVDEARLREDRHGAIARPDFLPEDRQMRVVLGPQDRHFTAAALAAFRSEPFALTNAFDRMGVRLSGPELPGGYPKIAPVIGDDIGRLSQLRAGDKLRFAPVEAAQAVRIARETAEARAAYLAAIAVPKGTLSQRLMRANLISGAISGEEAVPD